MAGYMGFGMRKEVYSRKPKKIHSRIKQLYGEKLDKHWDTKYQTKPALKELSEAERNLIKQEIRASVKKENRKKFILIVFSLVLTVISLVLIVWGIRLVFGF